MAIRSMRLLHAALGLLFAALVFGGGCDASKQETEREWTTNDDVEWSLDEAIERSHAYEMMFDIVDANVQTDEDGLFILDREAVLEDWGRISPESFIAFQEGDIKQHEVNAFLDFEESIASANERLVRQDPGGNRSYRTTHWWGTVDCYSSSEAQTISALLAVGSSVSTYFGCTPCVVGAGLSSALVTFLNRHGTGFRVYSTWTYVTWFRSGC